MGNCSGAIVKDGQGNGLEEPPRGFAATIYANQQENLVEGRQ